MTIITDPSTKKRTADTRAHQDESPEEHRPLLSPPPLYSPASSYGSSPPPFPPPTNGNPPPFPEKTSKTKFILVCLLMLLGVNLLFRLFKRADVDGSWSNPPTLDGKGHLFSILDSSRQTHQPHSNWPNQRLYSRLATIDLPLTSKRNNFFFHALGSDAVGKLEIVPGSNKEGMVKVEVRVVYATEEKLKERVRVYKMEDGDGRVGVDILTPPNHQIWTGASNYISFEAKIVLPARLNSSSSSGSRDEILSLGKFDGEANGMSLVVGDLGKGWRFGSFDYKTRNNGLSVKSLNSKFINLKTSNSRISASAFNATTLNLESSNGAIDLQEATVKARSINLHTSNGFVRAGESINGVSTVEADLIVIKTSNDAIRGSWTAKEIRATTSNAEISGSFLGIGKSLLLHTSNDPIRASIQTLPSSIHSPIPINIKTSSGSLDLTFQPNTNGKHTSALDASLGTSNAKVFVSAKDFLGEFDTRTSPFQKIDIECSGEGGRRVEFREGGEGREKLEIKGVARGKVLDGSMEKKVGGKLEVRTSNGDLKIEL